MGLKSCPFQFAYNLHIFSLFFFCRPPKFVKDDALWKKYSKFWSFISIYAQFKSVIRPQFKLILIIHSNGFFERNGEKKFFGRRRKNPGRLLKIRGKRKKRNYKFFLWHLSLDKFMILLMTRSRFLHKLRTIFCFA